MENPLLFWEIWAKNRHPSQMDSATKNLRKSNEKI